MGPPFSLCSPTVDSYTSSLPTSLLFLSNGKASTTVTAIPPAAVPLPEESASALLHLRLRRALAGNSQGSHLNPYSLYRTIKPFRLFCLCMKNRCEVPRGRKRN